MRQRKRRGHILSKEKLEGIGNEILVWIYYARERGKGLNTNLEYSKAAINTNHACYKTHSSWTMISMMSNMKFFLLDFQIKGVKVKEVTLKRDKKPEVSCRVCGKDVFTGEHGQPTVRCIHRRARAMAISVCSMSRTHAPTSTLLCFVSFIWVFSLGLFFFLSALTSLLLFSHLLRSTNLLSPGYNAQPSIIEKLLPKFSKKWCKSCVELGLELWPRVTSINLVNVSL